MSDNIAEAAVATLIADLEEKAWRADQAGLDEIAEAAARELVAARVQFADLIGYCD